MSAAFSPIMMVGALVLPPIRVGITEASTTRRPSQPVHFQFGIDHRHRVAAHSGGADRVIDGVDALAQQRADLVVGLDALGEHVLLLQGAQRRRLQQPPRDLEARDHGFEIGRHRRENSDRSAGRQADRRCRARRCRGSSAAAGRRAARSRCPGGACGRGRRPSPCRNAAGCRARRARGWFSGSRRIRRNSRSSARGARAGTGGSRAAAAAMPFSERPLKFGLSDM